MKKIPSELPDDVELLKKMLLEQSQLLAKHEQQLTKKDKRIVKLETLNQKLTERIQRFEEVLNLAQHKRFSPSSDTYEGDGQVFNEAEHVAETEVQQPSETQTLADETTDKQPAKARRPRIARSCRVLKFCTISTAKAAPAAAMPCTGWARKSASRLSLSLPKSAS